MDRVFRVGLAGFGMSGQVFHAPYLAADSRFALKVVYERATNRAAEQCPGVQVVRSYEALLESDVDIIVLCVPNALHVPMGSAALAAGKAVVAEKPLAPTAAEGERLFALARETGNLLAVYQNRRWDGGFLVARKLVEEGTLGQVLDWEARFDRWAPELRPRLWKETPQPASGVLYDLGSHLIDEVVTLFGMPQSVWADVAVRREGGEIDDDFMVHLFYPDLRCTLRASRIAAEEAPRLTVRGRKGAFTIMGGEDSTQVGRLTLADGMGLTASRVEIPPNAYGRFYDALYHSLADGTAFPVTQEQVVGVLRILEAAGESARSGGKVAL